MTGGFGAVFWKEWREMRRQRSGLAGVLISFVLPIALMGIVVPWQIGTAWIDTFAGVAFWCWLSLLLVTPHIADSIAGERERHTLETLLATPLSGRAILLGKAAAAALLGWLLSDAASVLALLTVNLTRGPGTIRLYPPPLLVGGLVLSGLSALLGTGVGVLISMRSSTARQAQQSLSLFVLFLGLVPAMSVWLVPAEAWRRLASALDAWGEGPLLALLIFTLSLLDLALLLAAAGRFRRETLLQV